MGSSVKQDTTYTYDLSGNITKTEDQTPNCGVAGANNLIRSFEYDPLYRLLSATGRESGQYSNSATPWGENGYVPTYPIPSGGGNTPANTRAYQRTYTYDHLGNILKLEHDAGVSASFNRYFNDYDTAPGAAYQTENTASKIKAGIYTTNFTFDVCGNPPGGGL